MLISQNKLAELTGKDRKTIKKLLAEIPAQSGPHRALLYDSARALEKIMLATVTGAFITTAEAFRQLTIARKRQIEIDVEIKRKSRIPIEDATLACNMVFKAIAGIIKGSGLPVESVNQIFDQMRQTAEWLRHKASEVDTDISQNCNATSIDFDASAGSCPWHDLRQ